MRALLVAGVLVLVSASSIRPELYAVWRTDDGELFFDPDAGEFEPAGLRYDDRMVPPCDHVGVCTT